MAVVGGPSGAVWLTLLPLLTTTMVPVCEAIKCSEFQSDWHRTHTLARKEQLSDRDYDDHVFNSSVSLNTTEIMRCLETNGSIRHNVGTIYLNYNTPGAWGGLVDIAEHTCTLTAAGDTGTAWFVQVNSSHCGDGPMSVHVSWWSFPLPLCDDWTPAEDGADVVTTLTVTDPALPFRLSATFRKRRLYQFVYKTFTQGRLRVSWHRSGGLMAYMRMATLSLSLSPPPGHWVLVTKSCGARPCLRYGRPGCDPVLVMTSSGGLWDVLRPVGLFAPNTRLFRVQWLRLRFPAYCTNPHWDNREYHLTFSYHSKYQAPEQLANGQWNCSVAHWPKFAVHFRCDLAQDCINGEDETDCPYRKHCGQGELAVLGRCYVYVRTHSDLGRVEAREMCAARGGYLVSLNTPKEAEALDQALHDLPPTFSLSLNTYTGLQRTDDSLPA